MQIVIEKPQANLTLVSQTKTAPTTTLIITSQAYLMNGFAFHDHQSFKLEAIELEWQYLCVCEY